MPPITVLAALAACLLVFVHQIWLYWFLTDDAFISFRYARNLSDGYGLVFNPGFERVEGYTNFLWVLILAAFDWLTAWEPHASANWISAASGLALWGLVVAFCWRRESGGVSPWLVVFPALWLALNRSSAVFCTSGLETKLFELFAVAGVFVGVREVERRDSSGWRSAALFALAALTRPDGILIGGAFFAARLAYEACDRRLDFRATARGLLPFVAVVGAHFAFRLAYYGDLLPNTYYAKLGGASWWDMGFLYLRTFLQEYGAAIWLPLLVVGVVAGVRARRPAAAWLIGVVVLVHAVYVAYGGGDHFEYRPLDLYFPLFAVLLYDGLARTTQRFGAGVSVSWGAACLAAILMLPTLTHVDTPSKWLPGFPGGTPRSDGNRDLIDLRQHPQLARIPGLSVYLRSYNAAYRELSRHFVGLRQEEHLEFLATVEPEGLILRQMVGEGLLPRDTFIAIPCVGAIPYFSNLRTLDELGLTDREIARQPMPPSAERVMGHDKLATTEYLIASGVDIVAPLLQPHLVTNDPAAVERWHRLGRRAGPGGRLYISKPVLGGYQLIGIMRRPGADSRFPALEMRPAWE